MKKKIDKYQLRFLLEQECKKIINEMSHSHDSDGIPLECQKDFFTILAHEHPMTTQECIDEVLQICKSKGYESTIDDVRAMLRDFYHGKYVIQISNIMDLPEEVVQDPFDEDHDAFIEWEPHLGSPHYSDLYRSSYEN